MKLLFTPGKIKPEPYTGGTDLTSLQRAVGGFIEMLDIQYKAAEKGPRQWFTP